MCSASRGVATGGRSPERRRPRRRRLSHGVNSLMYAAQQGDVERVRHLVRTQPHNLFDQDRTGKTALHYCCTSDSPCAAQSADFLVMAAPDLVETRDEDGFTPLHLAVIAGNTQLVTFLLANGADVAAVDNEKHTVVHWATVCGETTALRAVLSAGAPVSTPDVHGGYPLHYAAQMCGGEKDSHLGLQVLHTLLGHKDVNVSVEDGDKRQPLLWAASAGSAKAILALVRAGAIVESSDRDGLTALHCAASRGHTDCLDTLLTLCGASPDVIDSNGCTALHYAVTLGHADATALLLAHGADPNRQDRKGRSPAHCGCAKGQFETVKLIGARGANLWMRNARGDLPLHDAAASGRRELVAWLLSMRPSQVNARNNDGRTPLHMAALNDNVDMCKILLDSGSSVNPILRTSKNVFMTPLDCALQRGHRSTAKYLQLHGGVPASRFRNQNPDTQVSSSLSLQIRDDVTFWGDSSSNSDQERVEEGKNARKVQKRKISFKNRKKKLLMSGSESAAEVKTSEVKSAKTVATNTSASALEESPRKSTSSRIDYSNEIIINGKTEINIHHTNEITVDDGVQTSPRLVEIDSSEKITTVSSARPKSSKKLTPEAEEEAPSELAKSSSLGTSDDTMDTVIDTYKQKAESMRQASKEKMLDLPEISNTSEELEGPQEMVVEASVHAETTKRVTICEEENKEAPAESSATTISQQVKIDTEDKTVYRNGHTVEITDDVEPKGTNEVSEAVNVKNVEDVAEENVDENIAKETIIDSLTKAAVVKKTDDVVEEKSPKDVDNIPKDKKSTKDTDDIKYSPSEKTVSDHVETVRDTTTDLPPEKEIGIKEKKTPVSKVVGKPRQKKDADSTGASKQLSHQEKQKKQSKKVSAKDQPAIVKILKPGDTVDTAEESSSSSIPSDSMERAAKEHRSFKIISEKEAEEIENKSKKSRSKSDDSKFTKEETKMKKISKIPTPTHQVRLSKSDRQLDKLLDSEKRNVDARVPSLPNIHETSRFFKDHRPDSNLSAPILPSMYSDNERDSGSDLEEDTRSGPTKKKKVKKRPKTRRRESRSAGSDYESSNLIDSGFEPSPRSSRIPKWKNMSERGVNMTSVTRSIQSNIRRYHLERKIFQHLLELKRSQIRAGQHNEAVLVKRAIDQYNQSCSSTVGAGRYVPEDFTFKSFEKFLYDSLRKLQKIDVAHLRGLPDTSEHVNPLLCTQSTHRCMHATHAYTGIPCAAYLPKMDHHSIPKIGFANGTGCKPGTGGFLPSINNPKKAVTLELSHGTDKQVISLPTDKLDQNKRYYVTFTVKGAEAASSEENTNGHVHPKSD